MSTRLAIREANKSVFKQRLGAVITHGKRIIGKGYNETNRYTSHWTQHWQGSLHAEEAAILQAVKKHGISELNGSTIHVVRLDKSNDMAMAKPCPHCQKLLRRFQVKKVLYSTKNGMEVMEL
jgi:deoxycytidylate deaminase